MNVNLGWETNQTENQPRLKIFNLNSILTCNTYIIVKAANKGTFEFKLLKYYF